MGLSTLGATQCHPLGTGAEDVGLAWSRRRVTSCAEKGGTGNQSKSRFRRKFFSLQVGTAVPEGCPTKHLQTVCIVLGKQAEGLPQQVLWICSPCYEPTGWHWSPLQLPWPIVFNKGISASIKANKTPSSPSSSNQSHVVHWLSGPLGGWLKVIPCSGQ